ncbi:MAG: DUF4845 domain-containing protein [Thiobacillus sp.]|nr:DUF4845 domain-containing protein [Thiobacillus sp.]
MQRQRGFTLVSLIFMLMLAGFAALIAMKTVPTYINYFAVKKSLENILAEANTEATAYELRSTFDKRMDVNSIYDIKSSDLEVSRDNGMLTLSVPISSKKPIGWGIGVTVDLVATASTPLK